MFDFTGRRAVVCFCWRAINDGRLSLVIFRAAHVPRLLPAVCSTSAARFLGVCSKCRLLQAASREGDTLHPKASARVSINCCRILSSTSEVCDARVVNYYSPNFVHVGLYALGCMKLGLPIRSDPIPFLQWDRTGPLHIRLWFRHGSG